MEWLSNGGEVDSDTNYTLLVSATDVMGAIEVGDGYGVSAIPFSEQCAFV